MDADASLEGGLELKTKKVFEANLIFVRHMLLVCVIAAKRFPLFPEMWPWQGDVKIYIRYVQVYCADC